MLKKKNRLDRSDFLKFLKTGKRFKSEVGTLIFSPYPTLHGSVVVSKKVAKQAVERNRLRRVVYGLLQTKKQHNQTGVFIIILSPTIKQMTKRDFRLTTQTLIERITNHA
jgi:ribonuclease P protein component